MQRFSLLCATLLLVLTPACDWLDVEPGTDPDPGSDAKLVIMNTADDFGAWPSGWVAIDNPQVEDDLLRMTVGYSGCDIADFDLVVSSAWMESFPVQTVTHLSFEPSDCAAAFSHEVVFDLTPVKEAYAASYQTASGTIILHLRDHDGHQEVRYTF